MGVRNHHIEDVELIRVTQGRSRRKSRSRKKKRKRSSRRKMY